MSKPLNIALVGNPNSGKTSLFNVLTGMNQQVGNFPGVTVDKKTGHFEYGSGKKANLIDLPGTYSLYPRRADEWVAYKVLLQEDEAVKPDMVLLVADASSLKRNLLFCTQIIDLKIPVVMAFTMTDIAAKNGVHIDIPALERELGVPIVAINPRKNKGITQLKKTIELAADSLDKIPPRDFIEIKINAESVDRVQEIFPGISDYKALHYLINEEHFALQPQQRKAIQHIQQSKNFNPVKTQAEEILQRYIRIRSIMNTAVVEDDPLKKSLFTERLDKILLHRVWGYLIMLSVLFFLFQSVFWIAQYPMDAIDTIFTKFSDLLSSNLPQNAFTDLLINGVVAGLSGIVIFIPQIMILFGFISLLEDTGYMARISFLTDRIMRKVGLNGKSVMPMISGFACAVPAIMSARNIENKKERLLTILITPFMSCSARLPVFAILIALVVPDKYYFGFISLQGLVMMSLYLFGLLMGLIVAWVLQFFVKSNERSFFILELPVYRNPRWGNVLTTMVQKAKIFVFDAGKVIMVISLLLWGLSSYGPSSNMHNVAQKYSHLAEVMPTQADSLSKARQSELLENSYAGQIGHAIEPVIQPLGYDWKIGIALITSFAAREVFVGTMATLYSVGEDADETSPTLKQKMRSATRTNGSPVYTLATCLSLMTFYLIAMQCMSTLAVVYRETRTWKWPIIQFLMMTGLAYLFSFLVYNIFK